MTFTDAIPSAVLHTLHLQMLFRQQYNRDYIYWCYSISGIPYITFTNAIPSAV